MNAERVRTGGCLCGGVRYEVRGALRPIVICHCSQCRRQTSHVLAATAARKRDFHLAAQATLVWHASSADARRAFCGRCGSALFWEAAGRDSVSICAGTLDDGGDLEIACHIHMADKAPYERVPQDVPHYPDGAFSLQWP
jgi:hypothetical protein